MFIFQRLVSFVHLLVHTRYSDNLLFLFLYNGSHFVRTPVLLNSIAFYNLLVLFDAAAEFLCICLCFVLCRELEKVAIMLLHLSQLQIHLALISYNFMPLDQNKTMTKQGRRKPFSVSVQ